MTTSYLSFIRAINVGGKAPIKMAALKLSYEKLGFKKVSTYLQSGNVVFHSDDLDSAGIQAKIKSQIESDFGIATENIVLTAEELRQVVEGNPFAGSGEKKEEFLHVTFLGSIPQTIPEAQIIEKLRDGEAFQVINKSVYLYCPLGYGTTRLHNTFLEKKLGTMATTRNWKTVRNLLTLVDQ